MSFISSTNPNTKYRYNSQNTFNTVEKSASPHQCHSHAQQHNKSENNIDVSQHLKSLRARLGFARFKLNQGWEKSTIFDVEQLWRQRQKKNINNLPRPRFTQREIIDKRMYIPSPGARQARAKRDSLVRTLSHPTDWPESSPSPISKKSQKQIYFHHYCRQSAPALKQDDSSFSHQQRSLSYSPSSVEETDDEKMPQLRNSLDYLSYAIAMTEKRDHDNSSSFVFSSQPLPDISELEPNLINEPQEQDAIEELSISNKVSPPLSPVTSAAKTIMMFVNNCNTSSPSPAEATT